MDAKKVLKIIVAAIAITVFMAIVGMVTCGGIFSGMYKIEPTNVWKPMEGPPGVEFFIGSFVMNLIFVCVYALLRNGVPGRNIAVKGLIFGLCVWAVGELPGMFAMYSFMTVAPRVLVYWTIMGVITTPLSGIIAAAIYGKN
ncbi:MAG: hypothetical protein ACYC3B_06070 [Sedimentisphaerales bacterium]